VLVASDSVHDREEIEAGLRAAGFLALKVGTADGPRMETAMELFADGTPCVLVVDAVLLHGDDPSWRLLGVRHPGLGTVVRSANAPRGGGGHPRVGDEHTRFVQPRDFEALCRAIREVAAIAPGPGARGLDPSQRRRA
jgi:hypothetical protein